MKKKILALLSAAAMTVTALAVPFTASAEEVFADVKTVFSSNENTEWILHEQYGDMSAKVGEITLDSKNDKATGDSITLTIPETYNGESNGSYKPIQVRPNIGSTIALENGVTYDFTVNYTADIYSYSDGTPKDNAVYAAFISRDSDSKEAGAAKDQYGVKVNDEDNKTSSGKITGHFTPTKDNCSLEIQLYLRHAYGSVTFSNLEVTTTSVPEEAVVEVNGRYFTTLSEAVTAANDGDEVTLLKDATLSSRLTISKNVTITSDNKTISGSNNANMIIIKGGKTLTLNNTNVTSTKGNAIGVEKKGTKLVVNGGTIKGTISHNNGNDTSITVENATVDTISTRVGREPSVTGSSCNITINNSTVTSVVYNSKVDTYAPDSNSTVTNVTDSNATTPTGTITMTATYKGSYKGDDDSKAAAYTAEFTTDSEDQMGFNTKDVKWTLGNTSLKLSEASSEGTQISVTKGFEVTYGIIINGVFYDSEDSAEKLSAIFSN